MAAKWKQTHDHADLRQAVALNQGPQPEPPCTAHLHPTARPAGRVTVIVLGRGTGGEWSESLRRSKELDILDRCPLVRTIYPFKKLIILALFLLTSVGLKTILAL